MARANWPLQRGQVETEFKLNWLYIYISVERRIVRKWEKWIRLIEVRNDTDDTAILFFAWDCELLKKETTQFELLLLLLSKLNFEQQQQLTLPLQWNSIQLSSDSQLAELVCKWVTKVDFARPHCWWLIIGREYHAVSLHWEPAKVRNRIHHQRQKSTFQLGALSPRLLTSHLKEVRLLYLAAACLLCFRL